nr:MAG TPA: hypothetical protein [Caudoviricetes sp.]
MTGIDEALHAPHPQYPGVLGVEGDPYRRPGQIGGRA